MTGSQRRGACPSLAAPMQTGDGLLVRLSTNGATITLEAFAGLCAAARAHGNGIIEVTARGNLQIRGLTSESAPIFTESVSALGLDRSDATAVIVDPLSGLNPAQAFDATALAATVRHELAASPFASSLGPKASVIVDGGDILHLDALAADVRLRTHAHRAGVRLHVALGGDAATAKPLGAIDPDQATDVVLRLLEVLASRGPHARARDVIRTEGVDPFLAAVAQEEIDALQVAPSRATCKPVGTHQLRGGRIALGIGLAFGHAHADELRALLDAAAQADASGIRTAPGRALLILGLALESCSAVASLAERLGFIVRHDDARRHIFACAGSPVCAAAEIPTRHLAPVVATAAGPLLDGSVTVHLSGCAKGCAHPGAATFTFVGKRDGCAVLVNGSARDVPLLSVPTDTLPAALAQLAREVEQAKHPESLTGIDALPAPLPPRSEAERRGGVGGGGNLGARPPHPGALRAPTLPAARKSSRGEGSKRRGSHIRPGSEQPAADVIARLGDARIIAILQGAARG